MKVLFFLVAVLCSMALAVSSWSGDGELLNYDSDELQRLNPAQLNDLGARYVTGDGVEKNYDFARILWLKAAEHGHAGAQYNLGQMYST
ncbi:MAG: sel1 repeat family protein [Deltaproteobacteria bacterium]|jgi:TPR repeat protein|nr:sel1 repeat family protein [Deltaproteobacteria bacterium]